VIPNTPRLALPALLTLAVLVAACQPEAAPTPAPAAAEPAATIAPTPAPTPMPVVSTVSAAFAVTGDHINASTGTLPKDIKDFAAGDTVYAQIMLDGHTASTTVVLHWKDAAGTEIHKAEKAAAVEGLTPVIFDYHPDAGWAPGAYSLVFDIDGKPSWELAFSVH